MCNVGLDCGFVHGVCVDEEGSDRVRMEFGWSQWREEEWSGLVERTAGNDAAWGVVGQGWGPALEGRC